MAKSEEIVPEAAAKKANPNVCHKPKHTHWAKKVEPEQQVENADRIPTPIAEVLPRT